MIRVSGLLCALALCCLPAARGTADVLPVGGPTSEVVVTFASPPLAGLSGRVGREARRAVDREQSGFAAALRDTIPGASIHWRYRLVLNGAAVVVPAEAIPRLRALPGVKAVDVGASYAVASTTTSQIARAAATWQTGLPNRGDGLKIAIIDDGVDQRHPYFSPAGYTMPPGFPKGQAAFTTAKVIVARSFAPAGTKWKYARLPFDPAQSAHGTHVAGIAAGNANTTANGSVKVSGIAPRAYIGNYKALSVPTDADVGLDGNAPELVAAIEAAVADGMDVINLSIGEPEIEPSRDLVALALDAAAAAGVVPVVAAGNDFDEFGRGSLSSPGTSEKAITVAAVTGSGGSLSGLADFSASGPTPLSLRLKPDVSAPGVSILSSVPSSRWETMSGTSMASPQIAGAAALLIERHPSWSVAMLKAALIGSGSDVAVDGQIAAPTRGGGGLANPLKADVPLVLAEPAAVSFGLVRPGVTVPARVDLTDAGGGAGVWSVTVDTVTATAGAGLVAPLTVSAPGALDLSAVVTPAAAEGDLTGFVRLTRGADVRRVPFWLRVARPGLAAAATVPLRTPGLYRGDTRGKPSLASRYRYPDVPAGGAVTAVLQGPEQVFRFTLTRPVANFGVVIVRRDGSALVEPRVIAAGDENRLTGYAALPLNLNPYLAQFGAPVLAAGAVRPRAGTYDVVFDSPTDAGAGSFGFRFWVDDTKPPTVSLERNRVRRGIPLIVRIGDAGAGVDPTTLKVTVDGVVRPARLESGTVRIATGALRRGTHRLRLQVSDYQESRNMENVPPILPNTRVLTTPVVIR
jgi:subtilisin family serine protease